MVDSCQNVAEILPHVLIGISVDKTYTGPQLVVNI